MNNSASGGAMKGRRIYLAHHCLRWRSLLAKNTEVIAFSACPQDILPINGTTGKTTEAHFVIE
jgi:hypothetical protein